MLVKKKLLQIPPAPCPDIPLPVQHGNVELQAAMQVVDDIAVVDLYDEEDVLVKRFFADGNSWQYYSVENDRWDQRQNVPVNGWIYGYAEEEYFAAGEVPEDFQEVLGLAPWRKEDLADYLLRYTRSIRDARRRRYEKRKAERIDYMLERSSDVPKDFPKKFDAWLLKEVLPAVSMMGNKGKNKKNPVRCLSCGCRRQVTGIRHKDTWKCPKCGRETTVYAKRYITSRCDKERVAVAVAVPGGYAISAGKVYRRFDENGKQVAKYDRDRVHYNGTPETKNLYCPQNSWYGFKFAKWPLDGEYILYPGTVDEAFPEGPMRRAARSMAGHKTGVFALVDTRNPELIQTVVKARLYGLVEGARWMAARSPQNFEELCDIDNNYLHEFQVHEYGWNVARRIAEFNEAFEEERIYNPAELEILDTFDGCGKLYKLIDYMTSRKCINYFSKQMQLSGAEFHTVVDWYLDYISLARRLTKQGVESIDLTKTFYRYPKDVKEAHDRMEKSYEAVKDEMDKEKFRARAAVYSTIPQPRGNLMAVFPESNKDFTEEGNTLHHCVGWNPVYREGQLRGDMITFFIRKKDKPEEPYFTATYSIDKGTATFRESYGQSHKAPGKEVKKFIDAFMVSVNKFLQTQTKPALMPGA